MARTESRSIELTHASARLLCGACPRAAQSADPWARNDGTYRGHCEEHATKQSISGEVTRPDGPALDFLVKRCAAEALSIRARLPL